MIQPRIELRTFCVFGRRDYHQRWNGLNKMDFCPEICHFIRKGAIIMTWLQIEIAIFCTFVKNVAGNGILEKKSSKILQNQVKFQFFSINPE